MDAWLTVVETPRHIARASKLLSQLERDEVIETLAKNPTCGDVMKDTGGVRKVRVGVDGRGKSGGARVIYYFYNETMPLFLYTIYAKNEKANLSAAEKKTMAELAVATRKQYGGK